jgi:hypothetical protein
MNKFTVAKYIILACTFGLTQSAFAGIQTVYMCSLNEGASYEQLMKFEKTYVAELKKLKGADNFSVRVTTPIAAQAAIGKDFFWVGEVPDWDSYALMANAYETSKSAQKAGAEFMKIARCSSTSMWQSKIIN